MSRRPNRSAVLVERGPKERKRLGSAAGLMDPSREATAVLPSLRSDRRERALPDWRDRESIRAEFEAREAAGGRPSKRPAVCGSADRSCGSVEPAGEVGPNPNLKGKVENACS
jgi:hypothetical protein